MKTPALLSSVVVGDDAVLAAELSSILAQPRAYLPVIDGPRMSRPDWRSEVLRRNNGIARSKARDVFFAGLPNNADAALQPLLTNVRIHKIAASDDVSDIQKKLGGDRPILTWGSEHVGLGLLNALRSGSRLRIVPGASPATPIAGRSGHLVVCEVGEALSEVIAANYAYALDAGLFMISQQPGQVTKDVLEAFYSLNDQNELSPTAQLRELAERLRALCGDIPLTSGGSLTFITEGVPYGFAFPEQPSTHVFKYPDIGLAMINGFASEQPKVRGTNVAVLIDPLQADAPEIDAASVLLADRGLFVRGHRGAGATVHMVSQMIELYPYDLLILATHCGDADGVRQTYEFTDADGRVRRLVVDSAIGVGDPKSPDDKLEVMEFMRFRELDGVLWDDPDRANKVDVGSAIKDFTDQRKNLTPIRRETIPRVLDSAALKMFDHNYLPMPRSLAAKELPVIINNACASWRELAERFTFANARAYIGTLFPIATSEAHDVVIGALGRYFGKDLPHAFWAAQNKVYGDSVRRPYVVTGVYCQRLRITIEDVPARIYQSMQRELAAWRTRLAAPKEKGVSERGIEDIITFYEREVTEIERRWFGAGS